MKKQEHLKENNFFQRKTKKTLRKTTFVHCFSGFSGFSGDCPYGSPSPASRPVSQPISRGIPKNPKKRKSQSARSAPVLSDLPGPAPRHIIRLPFIYTIYYTTFLWVVPTVSSGSRSACILWVILYTLFI